MKGKIINKSMVLVFTLLLVFTLTVPVFADGEVTGTFGTTEAPQITSLVVYDAGTTDVAASLTPTQQYDVSITVTDADGIGELDNILLRFWYDYSGSGAEYTQSDFNAATMISNNARIQFTWNRDTNTAAMYDGFSATTWQLVSSTLPEETFLSDSENTSFTFVFRVQISKVAAEAIDGNVWQIAARVTDSGDMVAYLHNGGGTPGVVCNWYGEISVPESYTVDWGDIPPGTDFSNESAREFVNETINFLSNGNYSKQIKSGTSWTRTGGGDPAVLSDDAGSANTFALKALFGAEDYSSAVSVPATGDFVSLDDTATYTSEYGTHYEAYEFVLQNLYIKLNDTFNQGIYSGTIMYGIANR